MLEYLARKLGTCTVPANAPHTQWEIWLQQLDRLRARGAAIARHGAPLQEVLDDIRAEGRP